VVMVLLALRLHIQTINAGIGHRLVCMQTA
jgi:hypothetical protein